MDGPVPDQVRVLLRWLKDGPPGAIPIAGEGKSFGLLQAVTWEDAGEGTALDRLCRWHESAFAWFPEPFPVTAASVRQWLVEQVLPAPDRVLFWVRDVRGGFIGHVGLTAIDVTGGAATLSDRVAGHPTGEGLLTLAVQALEDWAGEWLQVRVRTAGARRAA